jgi:hypothetical protein
MTKLTDHKQLLALMQRLPDDYEPYGKAEREADCSCGCVYFYKLAGRLGMDWGVCGNLNSHRAGLLTFEHQGCHQFESKRKR